MPPVVMICLNALALLSVLLHAPTPTLAFHLPTITTTPPSPRTDTVAMSAVSSSAVSSLSKNPIVIFPAQFGIAKDYEEMIAELNSRGHPAYAVDLKRFDWLKITKSAVTSDYWKGTLKPTGTLDFYFDAVTATIDQVKAEFPSRKIHLVAHSIGGWVARAYVGEVADPQDVQKRFASLTTLGSPNYPPPSGEGFFSNLDQTRGLLEYVNSNFPGSFHKGMKYVSVGGIGTEGRLGWGLEENVAFISYLPLCGRGGGRGDGIIPEEIAFLEGAVRVEVEAKHSGFIPTVGPSIKIPGYVWYGTPGVLEQWLVHLPERRR